MRSQPPPPIGAGDRPMPSILPRLSTRDMRRSVRAVPDAVQERLIPYASKLPQIGVCSPLRSLRGRSRRRGRGVCRLDRFLVGPDVAQKHMRIKALVVNPRVAEQFLRSPLRLPVARAQRLPAMWARTVPRKGLRDAPKHQATPIGLLTLNQITIGPQLRADWLPIPQSRHGHHDDTSDRRRGGSSPCRTG